MAEKVKSTNNKVALFANDNTFKVVFTPFRIYYLEGGTKNMISSQYQTAYSID